MLFIGSRSFNGDGHGMQFFNDGSFVGQLLDGTDGTQLLQVISQLQTNAKTNDGIGNQTGMNQGNTFFGKTGKNGHNLFGQGLVQGTRREQIPCRVQDDDVMRLEFRV